MVDNKGCDDKNEPIRPYKNVPNENTEQAAAILPNMVQTALGQPSLAQIDKIIAELLILRQSIA